MKRFFLKFIIFLFLVLTAYVPFFSIEKIDKGKIGIVEDLRSKRVIRIYHGVKHRYNFIWQGLFPWWFSVYEAPIKRFTSFKIKIAIPKLESLKEDYYFIWVPVKIIYRIDADKFEDISRLKDDFRGLDILVKKYIGDSLYREFDIFFIPFYRREALIYNKGEIIKRVEKYLESEFQDIGLNIVRFEVSGNIVFPEWRVYNEGLRHAAEMRKMDKMIKKELKALKSRMETEKMQNEELYAKLLEISKIIRKNPDILKYIYIDKMGGNVELILSSDRTGIPKMFENEVKGSKKIRTGALDNLR